MDAVRLLIGVILAACLAAGCKTDQTPLPQVNVTEDNVADLIGASFADGNSSNGFTAQIGEAASVAGGGSLGIQPATEIEDALSHDTIIVRHDTVGNYSYNFTFYYSYTFYNGGDSLDFNYSMKGSYATPFLVSNNDTAVAIIHVSDILPPDTEYTINATYSRVANIASRVRTHNSFSGSLYITLTNVKVNKSNREIESGVATIEASGRNSNNEFFLFDATLTFTGPDTASLVVNGISYSVNLHTGIATRS